MRGCGTDLRRPALTNPRRGAAPSASSPETRSASPASAAVRFRGIVLLRVLERLRPVQSGAKAARRGPGLHRSPDRSERPRAARRGERRAAGGVDGDLARRARADEPARRLRVGGGRGAAPYRAARGGRVAPLILPAIVMALASESVEGAVDCTATLWFHPLAAHRSNC